MTPIHTTLRSRKSSLFRSNDHRIVSRSGSDNDENERDSKKRKFGISSMLNTVIKIGNKCRYSLVTMNLLNGLDGSQYRQFFKDCCRDDVKLHFRRVGFDDTPAATGTVTTDLLRIGDAAADFMATLMDKILTHNPDLLCQLVGSANTAQSQRISDKVVRFYFTACYTITASKPELGHQEYLDQSNQARKLLVNHQQVMDYHTFTLSFDDSQCIKHIEWFSCRKT